MGWLIIITAYRYGFDSHQLSMTLWPYGVKLPWYWSRLHQLNITTISCSLIGGIHRTRLHILSALCHTHVYMWRCVCISKPRSLIEVIESNSITSSSSISSIGSITEVYINVCYTCAIMNKPVMTLSALELQITELLIWCWYQWASKTKTHLFVLHW